MRSLKPIQIRALKDLAGFMIVFGLFLAMFLVWIAGYR